MIWNFAIGIGTLILVTGGILGYSRILFWKGQAVQQNKAYTELMSQALTLNALKAQAEQELGFVKGSVQTLLSRPIEASLSDEQAFFLVKSVTDLLTKRFAN